MIRTIGFSFMMGLVIAGAACERRGGSGDTERSGAALSDAETRLLSHLPDDVTAVFGGSYKPFYDHWEDSPLKEIFEVVLDGATGQEGMREYMECWLERDFEGDLIGALKVDANRLSMSMVIDGLERSTLTECTDRAGYAYRLDDDGVFLELELPDGLGGTSTATYYFIAETTVYGATDMKLGLVPAQIVLSRDELRARIDRAARSSAAESEEVRSMVAGVDRSRVLWLVGSAAGTPLSDALERGQLWFDLDKGGMTLGFSARLLAEEAAAAAVSQFKELSGAVVLLPADLRRVVESILESSTMTSSGKDLEGRFTVTNEALEELLPALRELTFDF